MEERYYYTKLDGKGEETYLPNNDYNGTITGTGKCVLNIKAWFDENPEIRKSLGYIKVITPSIDDLEYNKQTQYIEWSKAFIDEYTIMRTPHIINKSEEMLRLEELSMTTADSGSGLVWSPAYY